jgi:hypothetical protein
MGDDESRREDTRMEAAIERAIRRGDMGECGCGTVTSHKGVDEVGESYRWLCQRCHKHVEVDDRSAGAKMGFSDTEIEAEL